MQSGFSLFFLSSVSRWFTLGISCRQNLFKADAVPFGDFAGVAPAQGRPLCDGISRHGFACLVDRHLKRRELPAAAASISSSRSASSIRCVA